MASFIFSLLFLFLFLVVGGTTAAVSQSSEPSEPMCYDWGESSSAAAAILEGESGWLSCPLFSHPSVYNYSSSLSAGHNLFWYRIPDGHDLEQPISSRLSRDRDRLWLQPATKNDTGIYICLLRNRSSCSKISMRLRVPRPDDITRGSACEPPVAAATAQVVVPLQEGGLLRCPHLQDAAKMADGEPTVTWQRIIHTSKGCSQDSFWNKDREQRGSGLQIHRMLDSYKGFYFCSVRYQRRGRSLQFTRKINVTTVYPSSLPKEPTVLQPNSNQEITVRRGSEVRLVCRGFFPYLDSQWDIWWTIDGKTLEKQPDHHRFTTKTRQVKVDYGDRTEEVTLLIDDFQSEDFSREFTCSVRNDRGFSSHRARLREEDSVPSVELGCGLGVVFVLMLLLFVVYRVFWLEILLIYRTWFGSDERDSDSKLFDVYLSYGRGGDVEVFVCWLCCLLEQQGFTVCMFDRDTLPGGNLSASILCSMQRSRRLLFVVSARFPPEDSVSALELRLALALHRCHGAAIVTVNVTRRSAGAPPPAEAAQLRQAAAATLTWPRSRARFWSRSRSRFWRRLRLALPVRPLAAGRRLIDSASSHSDLCAAALRDRNRDQIHIQGQNQSWGQNQIHIQGQNHNWSQNQIQIQGQNHNWSQNQIQIQGQNHNWNQNQIQIQGQNQSWGQNQIQTWNWSQIQSQGQNQDWGLTWKKNWSQNRNWNKTWKWNQGHNRNKNWKKKWSQNQILNQIQNHSQSQGQGQNQDWSQTWKKNLSQNQILNQSQNQDQIQNQIPNQSHNQDQIQNQIQNQSQNQDQIQNQILNQSHHQDQIQNQIQNQSQNQDQIQNQILNQSHHQDQIQNQILNQSHHQEQIQNPIQNQRQNQDQIQNQILNQSHHQDQIQNETLNQSQSQDQNENQMQNQSQNQIHDQDQSQNKNQIQNQEQIQNRSLNQNQDQDQIQIQRANQSRRNSGSGCDDVIGQVGGKGAEPAEETREQQGSRVQNPEIECSDHALSSDVDSDSAVAAPPPLIG